MSNCKICNKEITTQKRWVYCSDECALVSKNIANSIKSNKQSANYKKQKATWTHEVVELNEIKHKKLVAVSQMGLSNASSTYLKKMLGDNDLTVKKVIKFRRIDSVIKSFTVVVVSAEMIKILFNKKYELYKKNFRLDTLRSVKHLVKAFNIVNDYFDKDTKSNTK